MKILLTYEQHVIYEKFITSNMEIDEFFSKEENLNEQDIEKIKQVIDDKVTRAKERGNEKALAIKAKADILAQKEKEKALQNAEFIKANGQKTIDKIKQTIQ